MGVVRTWEMRMAEADAFRRKLVAAAGINRRKEDERVNNNGYEEEEEEIGTVVCVTSGVSYLGVALVNHLLLLGYSVRITVDNPEEMEKVKEMERRGEIRATRREGINNLNNLNNNLKSSNMEIVIAKMSDVESLQKAFEGCRGVFHTSSFTDPAGLSGYTKSMAEIEVRVSEHVMEACARTGSIKRCVFTSSLSACLWQQQSNLSPVIINHASWSSESLCMDKKLWYALGKMRAEKTAWRIASEKGLNLTTICPALITGPQFSHNNPTPTIAYLKGAQEMYSHGLLATVDVTKLAEAHAFVFKEMKRNNASGRYICFDHIIENQNEAENLAKEISMPREKICGEASNNSPLRRFELSNEKLCRLMSRPIRCFSEY